MPNQKGFAPIIIVLILAAAASIGGFLIYTNYSNNRTKTTSSAPTQTQSTPAPKKNEATNSADTANWKTYIHSSYHYSFQYPPDWKLSISKGSDSNLSDILLVPSVTKSHMGDNISIVIHANPKNLTVEQLVSRYVAGGPYHFQSVEVNGVQAQKPLDVPEGNHVERIYIPHNAYIYELFIQTDAQDYIAVFNQILSTFKFLD